MRFVTYRRRWGFNRSSRFRHGFVLSNLQLSRFSGSIQRRVVSTALTLALCFMGGFAPALLAQKASKSERKVLVSVKPEYSDLLRHAQIGGLVRLKATVTPEGKVSHV